MMTSQVLSWLAKRKWFLKPTSKLTIMFMQTRVTRPLTKQLLPLDMLSRIELVWLTSEDNPSLCTYSHFLHYKKDITTSLFYLLHPSLVHKPYFHLNKTTEIHENRLSVKTIKRNQGNNMHDFQPSWFWISNGTQFKLSPSVVHMSHSMTKRVTIALNTIFSSK